MRCWWCCTAVQAWMVRSSPTTGARGPREECRTNVRSRVITCADSTWTRERHPPDIDSLCFIHRGDKSATRRRYQNDNRTTASEQYARALAGMRFRRALCKACGGIPRQKSPNKWVDYSTDMVYSGGDGHRRVLPSCPVHFGPPRSKPSGKFPH